MALFYRGYVAMVCCNHHGNTVLWVLCVRLHFSLINTTNTLSEFIKSSSFYVRCLSERFPCLVTVAGTEFPFYWSYQHSKSHPSKLHWYQSPRHHAQLKLRCSPVIGCWLLCCWPINTLWCVILYFNIYCDFYLYYFNLFFQSWISCHHTIADLI